MNRRDRAFHFRYWTSKTNQYTKSDQFYSYVFKCGENFSGLTSKEALHLPTKKRTRDHWLPARIFVRAMMQYQIQILNDYELFKYYFREVCQSTIEITEYQNNKSSLSCCDCTVWIHQNSDPSKANLLSCYFVL